MCPSKFVFFRVPLEPRVTADQSGQLPGVYATYNAVDPTTVVPSTSSYSSAGANSGFVGRSVVYVIRSVTNGATWDAPVPVDPNGGVGHQYFPDVDALGGKLVAIWQDNRTDDAYSVQLPIGNTRDGPGRPISSGTDVVGTYASVSDNGTTFTPLGEMSSATHQPSYEMFGNRQIPFQGDYNWVALAFDGTTGNLFGYMGWTDNRDVLAGDGHPGDRLRRRLRRAPVPNGRGTRARHVPERARARPEHLRPVADTARRLSLIERTAACLRAGGPRAS